jgi:hypothetical protein
MTSKVSDGRVVEVIEDDVATAPIPAEEITGVFLPRTKTESISPQQAARATGPRLVKPQG